ncbi:MAG: ThuA domain-containing protein, partial [Planctomycetota bacterium]
NWRTVDPAALLELLEAAQARQAAGSTEVGQALASGNLDRTAEAGRYAPFQVALYGGDAQRGKDFFLHNETASCARCHAVDGLGEVPPEVGPNLSSVGLLRSREDLLRSILEPAAEIAPGFELYDGEGKLAPISAMLPHYAMVLKQGEVRDLIEFLASLKKVKRLAVFVHSAGYEHEVAKRPEGAPSQVESLWQAWGKEDARFDVQLVTDPAWFHQGGLDGVDAVFFYTTGELPLNAAGRQALHDFVENGGGFIGSHCATDTFYEWPWFGEMIGGYFDGHPWGADSKVSIRVEDAGHLTCRHLPSPWKLTDEIYQFKEPYSRKKQHILLSLDPAGTDMQKEGMKRADADYPISWTRKQGKGRVFYTSLGHRPDVWTNPDFKKHLIEGLLYAAR